MRGSTNSKANSVPVYQNQMNNCPSLIQCWHPSHIVVQGLHACGSVKRPHLTMTYTHLLELWQRLHDCRRLKQIFKLAGWSHTSTACDSQPFAPHFTSRVVQQLNNHVRLKTTQVIVKWVCRSHTHCAKHFAQEFCVEFWYSGFYCRLYTTRNFNRCILLVCVCMYLANPWYHIPLVYTLFVSQYSHPIILHLLDF